jgi:DNA-binding GntR family transcriptional regulator
MVVESLQWGLMAISELVTRVGRPKTMGADVYAQMRELLMSGQLMPGEHLSLRTTALAMGVSVMPVREAMYQLVAEQALEITANRVIRVPLTTEDQFREITAIRVHLEGFAVYHAALRAGEALAAELNALNAKLEREMKARQPDASRLILLNKELHFAAYRAAAMPTLLQLIESLWLRIGPILNYDLRGNSNRIKRAAVEHHAALIGALARKDGTAACNALRADIESAAEYIITKGVLSSGRAAG